LKRIRLLLADDHALVVAGFRKLLESEFEIVGIAEDGRTLIAEAQRLNPDVILLDISMPLLNGIEAAKNLKKTLPATKLVFVTMHTDIDYVREAFRAGASGYLLKRSAASELVPAIHDVFRGKTYITPLIRKDAPDPSMGPRRFSRQLTARHREVLQLVAEGRTSKDIAAILNVSIKTVEYHKACIVQRLGIHTTAELTRYAIEHGIIGP
jgi:DNA-binding NarL/FixJ family response regulator